MEVPSGFVYDNANDLAEDAREGAHSLVFEVDGWKADEIAFWCQVACLRVRAERWPELIGCDADKSE